MEAFVDCNSYSPDNVFQRFKVVEFPTTFVGLYSTMYLDVEINLETCAYLKTFYRGRLWKLEEAREISACHRAFNFTQIDDHTLKIDFKPTNECISNAKRDSNFSDRFVFDIHVIKINCIRCCNNEEHSEVGRFYVCGRFEYCQISHNPIVIDFGDVVFNKKVTQLVHIYNDSHFITIIAEYIKVTGFDVVPNKFVLSPGKTKKIYISFKPASLVVLHHIFIKISSQLASLDPSGDNPDDNFLLYKLIIASKVSFEKKPSNIIIESLHKLYEKNPIYTFTESQLLVEYKKKDISNKFFQICKTNCKKKPVVKRIIRDNKNKCFDEDETNIIKRPPRDFCKPIKKVITIYDLFAINFCPISLNFGRVTNATYANEELKITNNSKYEINISFLKNACISYTHNQNETLTLKLQPFTEEVIAIYCLGYIDGLYSGTFDYTIESIYDLQHPYILQVGNPTLAINEHNLKFGMVTIDNFTTSVPVRIYNNFNTSVGFEWEEFNCDIPFMVAPRIGMVPRRDCRICDVQYVCKPTKSKSHEVEITSCGITKKILPVELNIITRKHSIKFQETTIIFKDIPLNLEVTEKVKLENNSREFAVFHVVESLIPGLTISPMFGIIKPKTIVIFEIKVQISCVLDIAFEINLKINNKENIYLPVSGNVVEPKITIYPKNINLSRVPCNLITYIPVVIQNVGKVKSLITVIDTHDENIFGVYISNGNEKHKLTEIYIAGGQSRTVYIKVCDIFRREYDMYLPFQINNLLGPPDKNSWTIDMNHYISTYEKNYECNTKVKLKHINKDICYCRIIGVITLPWIHFSQEVFEIIYDPLSENSIEFSMTNISKYNLTLTILTSKLNPHFTLTALTIDDFTTTTDTSITIELFKEKCANFCLTFQPKGSGRFIAVPLFYLDKNLSIPYSNLTFIGRNEFPILIPSTFRLIFPPCYVEAELTSLIDITFNGETTLDMFSYVIKPDENVTVSFIDIKTIENHEEIQTIVTAEIYIHCENICIGNSTIKIVHENGAICEVEVCYCYTKCPLTLHANIYVNLSENPYPYYPSKQESYLYDYMNKCIDFLEKWLFQQGFRKEFYPVIPDTLFTISCNIQSQSASGTKTKGINVSYINFIRRIAGPLMKHIRKIPVSELDEDVKNVKETHNTYKEIIKLLRSRGADIWALQAKYLLSYENFVLYCENISETNQADIANMKELINNEELFYKLSKQSWIDFILQSYKVFILESCFFECVCINMQHRNIVNILIDWFNEQIQIQYKYLFRKSNTNNTPIKKIKNLTTDMSDCIAFVSAILHYCPYMKEHFSLFCEVDEVSKNNSIIHNACLLIEALNLLRVNFPLNSEDLIEPNFLQMFFLSVHLYIVLPTYIPRETITFKPPLLRTSSREISIGTSNQESLIFTFVILNNYHNMFTVEKVPNENNKKIYFNIKYEANFIKQINSILLLHGYNKTRIFDTYIVFLIKGCIGSLVPLKKYKIICPLYRSNKVDILVSSPFCDTATYNIYITDREPTLPVNFNEKCKSFYIRRLNLIDQTITLNGMPKEGGAELPEHKLFLQMNCLSVQVGNTWIWFRSEVGDFFVKINTQPRSDLPLDMFTVTLPTWPLQPCSCAEDCECYRTTVLLVPHKNELMVKALRYALLENSSEFIVNIFDKLIETDTGKIVLAMLFKESGTDMSEVGHILNNEVTYHIASRFILPRIDTVTFAQHSNAVFALPITIVMQEKLDKYSITLTSECGMDVRTYKVIFIEEIILDE